MNPSNIRTPFLRLQCLLLAALWLFIVGGCTKVVSVSPLRTPDNSGDTTHDVRKMLDSIPQFSLFALACHRASIQDKIKPATFFTLFVPTDSAMKAAGLTQDGINSIPVDSLIKILLYHFTYGVLSDTTLGNALVSVQQNCVLETSLFNPPGAVTPGYSTYRHSLYVKNYKGRLCINGWAVNNGEAAIKASNGCLYPIHQVLIPPTEKISDVVFGRPEFSYYAAAIMVLDSVYRGLTFNNSDQIYEDTMLFSQLRYEETDIYPPTYPPNPMYPTVFAPTNTAFTRAGFPDIDSIKRWVLSKVRVDTIRYSPTYYQLSPVPGNGYHYVNGSWQYGFNYATIDSVMKTHYLLTSTQQNGQAFSAVVCYNDLVGNSSFNSGVLNRSSLNGGGATIAPYNLKYHTGDDGVLNIQWNAAGTDNAVIPLDKDQTERQRSFWTMNGVVYASDQLFYNN
ncbi:MAG: fasciclin domain-containing protein [Chitinophagaceae bacterium]|nr:fasciclin domain-containing protein [Chitinophagaceae bacterium]